MKLIAMMMVRNEADRYLGLVLEHLSTFCDQIVAFDDCSTDGSHAILSEAGAQVYRSTRPIFYEHEGKARNLLLDFTLEAEPTHILAIDADEMIAEPDLLRDHLVMHSSPVGVWNLWMEEIWRADEQHLYQRIDGQWGSRKAPIVFEVPPNRRASWRIADRALACGREPTQVAKTGIRSRQPPICSVFHFGWTCQSDRQQRYDRYVQHDGGAFHPGSHLASIMNPDSGVEMQTRAWPADLLPYRERLLDRINR